MESLNPTAGEGVAVRTDEQQDVASARFGRLLRRAREARGLSLSNVAEQVNTTGQRLQRIEAGGDLPLSLAARLGLLFDLDPYIVFYGQKVAPLQKRRRAA